jgi:hypothetical protein
MNKHGWVALPIIVLAFWFGIFLFYSNLDSQSPGGDALYLGEHSMNIYETYYKAELDSYYYELAAQLSAGKADEANFENEFKQYFSEYIASSKLTIDSFDVTVTASDTQIIALVKSKEKIEYKNGPFTYSVPYSFSVSKAVTPVEISTPVQSL